MIHSIEKVAEDPDISEKNENQSRYVLLPIKSL